MKLYKVYYLFAALFYIIGVSLYVYVKFEESKRDLFEEIDEKLINGALRIPTMFADDFHHVGMKKEDVSPQQDKQNIQRLSVHAKLSGVEYIYSCIKQGDDILFTSSSATDEELKNNKNLSHYFDVYDDASQPLKSTFITKKMVFEEYTDKWGHFKSVVIPQIGKDGQLYVVCADVRIDFIEEKLRKLLNKSIFEIIFYMAILIPMFVVYVYHNRRVNMMLEVTVKRRTRELKALLDGSGQGFLSFSRDMLVHTEYSKKCNEIFDTQIEGHNIAELLYGDEQKQKNKFIANIRSLIGDKDELKVENILSLLRSEFTILKKTITVEYRRISTKTFMLILTDVTEKVALEKKLDIEKKKLQMVVSAVENSGELLELLRDYREFMLTRFQFIKNDQTALQSVSDIYRAIHTFKGLFAQKDFIVTPMGLHKLEEKLSELIEENFATHEQLLTLLKKAELENWLDRDLSVLTKVLGDDFLEKKNEIKLRNEDIDSLNATIRLCAQNAQLEEEIIEKIIAKIERLKEKSLSQWLFSYSSVVEKLAHKLGKNINPIEIECDVGILLEESHKPFIKSLIHVFRNCVDHGIESPEERSMRGKADMGTISCRVTLQDGGMQICVKDDGAGINTFQVSGVAIKKGILTEDAARELSANAINTLIFDDNFSTKDSVSDLSGRGVGLWAVRRELEELGGTFFVTSTDAAGVEFTFFIPTGAEHESFAFNDCQAILNPIASRTGLFLSEDMGLELASKDFEIISPLALSHYEYMVKIGITGSVNSSFIMGFETNALRGIAASFDDEYQDTDDVLIYGQVACEIANTVLGNAIANFPNNGHGVIITPPLVIAQEDESLRNTNATICSTEIKTLNGLIMVAIFKEIKCGDSKC